jgi:hypothetical protein
MTPDARRRAYDRHVQLGRLVEAAFVNMGRCQDAHNTAGAEYWVEKYRAYRAEFAAARAALGLAPLDL